MIRTIVMLAFWAAMLPIAAILSFPFALFGDIGPLYRIGTWAAFAGVSLAGVKVETVGMDRLDRNQTYIFMFNHISNIDPPIAIPLLPGRTSVMVKKELFHFPIFGKAMRLASLVPVDRGNRDAGIAAVREALEVVKKGIHMCVFVEGHRSYDGKLLPFKKGPFYLAEECQVPVVPVTISGTHYVMPKGRFSIKPGLVTLIFHEPIEPAGFGTREQLMQKVRDAINRGLPPEYQS